VTEASPGRGFRSLEVDYPGAINFPTVTEAFEEGDAFVG
jgi:hypothetical protein